MPTIYAIPISRFHLEIRTIYSEVGLKGVIFHDTIRHTIVWLYFKTTYFIVLFIVFLVIMFTLELINLN